MEIFPEGQLCVTVNSQVVAAALSIIVDYDLYGTTTLPADRRQLHLRHPR